MALGQLDMACYQNLLGIFPNFFDFKLNCAGEAWLKKRDRKSGRCLGNLPGNFARTHHSMDFLTGYLQVSARVYFIERIINFLLHKIFLSGGSKSSCLERTFWVGIVLIGFACAFMLVRSAVNDWIEHPTGYEIVSFSLRHIFHISKIQKSQSRPSRSRWLSSHIQQ